ncbi:MAG: hypothetical protein K2N65_01575, partial [Anaeroplasmataceae bacterium]|nr:hypothetical protein [Anaeroplasmataceae bacterium]
VYDLGEIEDIVRRVDPSHRSRIRYEEDEDEHPRRDSRRNDERQRRSNERQSRREARRESSTRAGVGVVLLICLFPLWIALFSILFGAIVAILGAGVGCFAGGIVCIWHGCTLFASSWPHALFQVGIGISLIGAVLIIGPLLLKIVTFIGHIIVVFFKWLFGERRR